MHDVQERKVLGRRESLGSGRTRGEQCTAEEQGKTTHDTSRKSCEHSALATDAQRLGSSVCHAIAS
jgi:hypothetical protein